MSIIIRLFWRLIAAFLLAVLFGAALQILQERGYPLISWSVGWMGKMSGAISILGAQVTLAEAIVASFLGAACVFLWCLFRVGARLKTFWFRNRERIFDPKIEEIRELIRILDQLLGLPITKDRDEERIGSLFNELRNSPHTIWKDQELEYLRYDYLTAVKKVSDLKDNFSKLVESDTQEKLEEAQDELSSIAEKLDKRISFVVQFFQRKN